MRVRIYRFRNNVVLDGMTDVFLSPENADAIADALRNVTNEIRSGVPFSESTVGTVTIGESE